MSEPLKKHQPSPRHYMQPRSVWNDVKGRTMVCLEIWENGQGYQVDFLVIGGEKVLEYISVPWMKVLGAIEGKRMAQADISKLTPRPLDPKVLA